MRTAVGDVLLDCAKGVRQAITRFIIFSRPKRLPGMAESREAHFNQIKSMNIGLFTLFAFKIWKTTERQVLDQRSQNMLDQHFIAVICGVILEDLAIWKRITGSVSRVFDKKSPQKSQFILIIFAHHFR